MEKIQYEINLEKYNKVAEVTLYPILQEAIDNKWDSLCFAENNRTFADVKIGDHLMSLITDGDVRIRYKDRLLVNKDGQELKELIISGQLNPDNCHIEDNNWFTMSYGEIVNIDTDGTIESIYFDDCVYEGTPEYIEAFKEDLVGWIEYFYEDHIMEEQ